MTDDEQYIIERFEDEAIGPCCAICGDSLEWQDCYQCGGQGLFDWEDLQEIDPLWYQPGDTEACEQCAGRGGWWMPCLCPHADDGVDP